MDPLGWLLGLEQFGIKLGLESVATILAELEHPERAFRSAHIAGTNGKGSVTAMADAVFQAAGLRSARYTSPHLIDLTERFVIDGTQVSTDALVDAVADVRTVVDSLHARGRLTVHPTFFEVTTVVAFELFRRAQVEVAVCETGLGGRLDATNVLMPEVTAITTIGLDHQQHLGNTLALIAREKAGIIKPGVPLVVGRLPPSALDVITDVARERGSPVLQASDADTIERVNALRLGLAGAHQRDNAAVALRVVDAMGRGGERLRVSPAAIAEGFEQVRWPGRLEWRRFPDGREALLDAAHNPEGAAALAAFLSTEGGHDLLPLVFGVMSDKDATGIIRALAPVVSAVVCTRASTPRAADPSSLAAIARDVAPHVSVFVHDTPGDALAHAWRLSRRIVVAGSIFLLGDVIQIARDAAPR